MPPSEEEQDGMWQTGDIPKGLVTGWVLRQQALTGAPGLSTKAQQHGHLAPVPVLTQASYPTPPSAPLRPAATQTEVQRHFNRWII